MQPLEMHMKLLLESSSMRKRGIWADLILTLSLKVSLHSFVSRGVISNPHREFLLASEIVLLINDDDCEG